MQPIIISLLKTPHLSSPRNPTNHLSVGGGRCWWGRRWWEVGKTLVGGGGRWRKTVVGGGVSGSRWWGRWLVGRRCREMVITFSVSLLLETGGCRGGDGGFLGWFHVVVGGWWRVVVWDGFM
ncbi:hypothetical protein HanPI659440_Chr10g0378621 [Helianthus annuus]|nr:hypothetical protein HanPI659440_Chr10g0378621 [Helianthus annuus]